MRVCSFQGQLFLWTLARMEHLRRDEKRLPLGAVDPEASLLGDNQVRYQRMCEDSR